MELKQKILEDCRNILKCHINKDKTDWDLWWRQVHAMDAKYSKYDQLEYEYMQVCLKWIFKALQTIEGVELKWQS